jgi:hypothetical protein
MARVQECGPQDWTHWRSGTEMCSLPVELTRAGFLWDGAVLRRVVAHSDHLGRRGPFSLRNALSD